MSPHVPILVEVALHLTCPACLQPVIGASGLRSRLRCPTGGAEHAVLHLLYARFWHKVLYDLGVVSTKEPFRRLVSQGMILGEVGGCTIWTIDVSVSNEVEVFPYDSLCMPLTAQCLFRWSTLCIRMQAAATLTKITPRPPQSGPAPPLFSVTRTHQSAKLVG